MSALLLLLGLSSNANAEDRGGHLGVGLDVLSPGLLAVEVDGRTGRLAGRLAAGWVPYTLLLDKGSTSSFQFNPGDLSLSLSPRFYLNKSMEHRYQHALEAVFAYTVLSLDPDHPRTMQQLGLAVNYAGEVYVGRRAAFTFGGGFGARINGNPDAVANRFTACDSWMVDCSSTASKVQPWLDLSAGFRVYFL